MNNYPPNNNNNYQYQGGSNPFSNPNPQYDPYYRIIYIIQLPLKKHPTINPEESLATRTKDSTKESITAAIKINKTIFMVTLDTVSSERSILSWPYNYLLRQELDIGDIIAYGSNRPLEIWLLLLSFQFWCSSLPVLLDVVCKLSDNVLFPSS